MDNTYMEIYNTKKFNKELSMIFMTKGESFLQTT